jgi:1-acyl-sn-glycerol-3-phosphate acyltransferase
VLSKKIRLAARFLFFLSYTGGIVAEVTLRSKVLGQSVRQIMPVRRRWARYLLHYTGVRIRLEGEIPRYCCLIVSNHRAHLDPLLILRDVDAYPVAKAEIANWPLIGAGGRMAGMLFVQRDDPGSRVATVRAIAKVLKSGYPLVIFPEGDTSALDGTLPFKRAVFELAARMQVPVVPVALCFADERDCWVGQESFLSHAARRFSEKEMPVTVCYGPPIRHTDAGILMQSARQWIDDTLATHPLVRWGDS